MTDDIERRLRRELPATVLPAAPASLRDRLEMIVSSDPTEIGDRVRGRAGAGRMGRARLVVGFAAILLVGGSALSLVASRGPSFPNAVDGLPVMTVSEALAAHEAGTLPGGRAAVRGWWSDGSGGHLCAPAPLGDANPGDLELYCSDDEYGITELEEPIYVVEPWGEVRYEAKGPHLTPYVPNDLARSDELRDLPIVDGERYPPVPILVIGHFDDPLALRCRVQFRALCRARLFLERIVVFDPASVAPPGLPGPTAVAPVPVGPFEAVSCAGEVPYSFVGWTTTGELDLPFDRPGQVFAMVTRYVVLLTDDDWVDDPKGSSHRFQIWGRKVCIAQEGDPGVIEFGSVGGSTYVLWDDQIRVPGDNPVRP